ncbi:rho guanine nucleotide exchange factor 39-like [Sinocyclocheilus grahami]|uniref:rho guanine nucleotide exchange factor 39-like n=1 Tax=Sinocyclocheilus grahami TaxID=75366 RepID=UPI0007ACB2D5|nr:PREDICTED: rho guanine nucleotide exchange factor 39-like [Sinocyclocheilus grahami]
MRLVILLCLSDIQPQCLISYTRLSLVKMEDRRWIWLSRGPERRDRSPVGLVESSGGRGKRSSDDSSCTKQIFCPIRCSLEEEWPAPLCHIQPTTITLIWSQHPQLVGHEFCSESVHPHGHLRSIQEQRDRWERKRSRTARELVLSEQRYCEQLDLVVTYFVEILKAKGTLRQDIRESIFSSIKSIHLINQTLLTHLELGRFGIGFEEFCTHLQLYKTYVDNIQTANKVLMVQVKKSKAFRRFKKLQESRPELNQQKLEDLLTLPLQRIQHKPQDFVSHPEFSPPSYHRDIL